MGDSNNDNNNNYTNKYNYDSVIKNKKPRIINVGVQCLVYERTCQWHEK